MEVWKFGIVGGDEVQAFGRSAVRRLSTKAITKNRKIAKSQNRKNSKVAKLQSCYEIAARCPSSIFQLFRFLDVDIE